VVDDCKRLAIRGRPPPYISRSYPLQLPIVAGPGEKRIPSLPLQSVDRAHDLSLLKRVARLLILGQEALKVRRAALASDDLSR
jgi:hypothetical protein